MDPFLAQIVMFGGNFAPRGWAYCSGQLMAISSNTALFSLLGTTYGGDGRTSFGLPDLRGRVPIHPGTGPGLSTRRLGQRSGLEYNTMTTLQMPSHTHTAIVTAGPAVGSTVTVNASSTPTTQDPTGAYWATDAIGPVYGATKDVVMAADAVEVSGGGALPQVQIAATGSQQPINNMQPFLGINYIIATQGVFPSRN